MRYNYSEERHIATKIHTYVDPLKSSIPVLQPINYKYIIFNLNDKHFVGSFSKDITTQYVYEYVKKQLKEKGLINQNDDIKIITFRQENILKSYETINEIFKKNQNCEFIKLKIIISDDKKSNIVNYTELANNIRTKYKNYFQIFCKTYTGGTSAIQVSEEMTTEELKILLFDKYGNEPDMQRIIFCGLQLEDDCKLSSYKIGRESTIHLVLRLRGGMFIEISSGNIDYKKIKEYNVDFDFDI